MSQPASFTGTVLLSVGGLPAGVTGALSSPSVTGSGSVTLTLTSAYSAATQLGTSPIAIAGTSSGYPTPATASLSLTTRALQYPCVAP